MDYLNLDAKLFIDKGLIESPNLCDRFEKDDLEKIGAWAVQGYDRDKSSREKWEKRMDAGMDLAMQIQKDKNFPWTGCSNVIFPLVTIAALQFSATSYGNIIQGTDVVKYRVIGDDPQGELRARGDRIATHMSWQVLEEDESWEEQHDRLLINLGIVGTSFIKSYYDGSLGHNVSELVQARDFVLNYWAKSVEKCPRKTQVIEKFRNDIYEAVQSGIYRDVLDEEWYNSTPSTQAVNPNVEKRSGLMEVGTDEDTPFQFLEQHRLLDLDKDGYGEPYIVTVDRASGTVLRIVARFDKESDVERKAAYGGNPGKIIRITPTEYYTKFTFIPAPDGGVYDLGFGTLLGPLNESVNSGINQLLDAGTMANSNGGFLGRGAKIRGGVYTMAPWEWKRVDSTGDDLRKSMVQLPIREPSAVMFQLISLIIQYTDRVAGTVDQMVGENPGQNTPAETSRNMTEQGMKVYKMIFKRVWRSLKGEFKKLHHLNATYLPQSKRFGSGNGKILLEDYRSNPDLVIPSADPNITSDSLRVAQAQMVREAAHSVPGYNIPEVEKRFLKALRIDGVDQVYPGADKVPPLPNPKMAVEQAKMEGVKMKLAWEKEKLMTTLQSEGGKVQAKIRLMEAEIMQIAQGVTNDQSAAKILQFEKMISIMKDHNEMIDNRLKTLKEVTTNDNPDEGGAGRLAAPSGDSSSSAAA